MYKLDRVESALNDPRKTTRGYAIAAIAVGAACNACMQQQQQQKTASNSSGIFSMLIFHFRKCRAYLRNYN